MSISSSFLLLVTSSSPGNVSGTGTHPLPSSPGRNTWIESLPRGARRSARAFQAHWSIVAASDRQKSSLPKIAMHNNLHALKRPASIAGLRMAMCLCPEKIQTEKEPVYMRPIQVPESSGVFACLSMVWYDRHAREVPDILFRRR